MIRDIAEIVYEIGKIWFYLLLITIALIVSLIATPFVLLHRLYTYIYEGVIYERETEDGDDQRSKARRTCSRIYRRIMGRKMS